MTRLERRRRRQWIAAWVILIAAVLAWAVTLWQFKKIEALRERIGR